MRRPLCAAACVLSWAALLWCGLQLWAALDYCRGVPALYGFFGAEALAEQIAKGQVWAAVQGAAFLLAAAVCLAATRGVIRGRKTGKKSGKNHEDTAFDRERD